MRYLLIICILTSVLFASVRDIVGQGNDLFAKGDYENAQLKYEQALKLDPACEQAMYNLGVTQMKNGQNEEAVKTFMSLAGKTENKDMLARAQRNIGAIGLEEGLKFDEQQQPDEKLIDKKIESLDSSIEYLDRARKIEPAAKDDINRGIEAARLGKVSLEEIKKQIEEQQKQQQQAKDDMKKKLDDLQKQQQDMSQQSGQQAQQPQEGKQQELEQKQQDLTKQTQEVQQQAMQSPPEMDFKEAAEKMKEAVDKQNQAQQQLSQGDFKEAEKSQEQAAEKLGQAKESLEKEQENKEKQDSQDKQGDKQQDEQKKDGQGEQKEQPQEKPEQQDGEKSQEQQADQQEQQKQIEQAEKLDNTAQEILDKEKENRKERVIFRVERRTVEKDW